MVYTSNRDGGGSVPSGHLAHPPPEGRLRRTGIFILFLLDTRMYSLIIKKKTVLEESNCKRLKEEQKWENLEMSIGIVISATRI